MNLTNTSSQETPGENGNPNLISKPSRCNSSGRIPSTFGDLGMSLRILFCSLSLGGGSKGKRANQTYHLPLPAPRRHFAAARTARAQRCGRISPGDPTPSFGFGFEPPSFLLKPTGKVAPQATTNWRFGVWWFLDLSPSW